jgi:DNA-binding sugar fermentation-stimulating protein
MASEAITLSRRVAFRYPCSLNQGLLIQRYKRFLADIDFPSSSVIDGTKTSNNNNNNNNNVMKTVYCPNTGSMYGLLPSPSLPRQCACSIAPVGSTRKYEHTLEMILDNACWVGIHSSLANNIVKSCLLHGWVDEYTGFSALNTEVTVNENCKLDFELLWTDTNNNNNNNKEVVENDTTTNLLYEDQIDKNLYRKSKTNRSIEKASTSSSSSSSKRSKKPSSSSSDSNGGGVTRRVLLEVKSVTLAVPVTRGDSRSSPSSSSPVLPPTTAPVVVYSAQFPDCVSTRAQKHCQYLTEHVTQSRGGEAAIVFLIQRDDCSTFSASSFDPTYGKLLSRASQAGVRILPYVCKLDPVDGTIELIRQIPFVDTYLDLSLS